jgi:NADPH:quinone reductase-like Zn-dependent oxidoreductase
MPKRLVFTRAGTPETMRIESFEASDPGDDEVAIDVAYAGINFADLLQRLGLYSPRPPYPFTPGYEASGTVVTIGSDVDHLEVGDAVIAVPGTGAQTSHLVCKADRVVRVPESMSLQAAAAMPVTYLTAHHMLHHLGHLSSEESVLIHGGGGGVGTAALQLCRWAGVEQVWATASAGKADIIRSFGGTPIDRHMEDFVDVVRKGTDGVGVDHVLDPIGGDHLVRSLSACREGGRVYTYGMSTFAPSGKRRPIRTALAWLRRTEIDPLRLMNRNRALVGVHMGTWSRQDVLFAQMERLVEGVMGGQLDPVIDCVMPLEEAAAAHHHLHDGKNIGKVLFSM